jgi:MFS family permease
MSETVAHATDAHGALKARELALLYLPLFTVALGYGAVLPILPSLLERLHGPGSDAAMPLHAGLLTGIYIGAFVIGAPLWGKVTDLRGPRIVMLVGLLGYAAATAWFGFATSLAAAYVTRFVAGAFAAGLLPATAAFIVARCGDTERARHLGWMSAASVMGFFVGPALSGWMHDFLTGPQPGWATALHVTAVPIWMTGVIALASAFGVAWGVGSHRVPGPSAEARAQAGARRPPVAPRSILLLSALGAFGIGALEVGLALQSQQSWRWSPSALGWLFAVCSLVMFVIQFAVFAPLRRHVPPETLVVGCFTVMAAGFALLAGTSVYGIVMSLVALIALGSGVLLPTLSVATADQAGAAVGTAIGYQNAAGNLGQAVGSAAVGLLFSAWPVISFGIVALVMFATALAGWRIARVRGALLSGALMRDVKI